MNKLFVMPKNLSANRPYSPRSPLVTSSSSIRIIQQSAGWQSFRWAWGKS